MSSSDPNLKAIFGKALEFADPAVRADYLAEACSGNAALRAEIEGLMGALEKAGSFLEAAPRVVQTVDRPAVSEIPGVVIGPYKLIEQIGEGGMGTVWMAQQTEPVKRVVALKLIKAGMDSRQVVARFEAERQALALMDHPNIARVLDAGATSSGRPYFVMELVRGVPITRYCDDHRLTPRQRLELFVPICAAVQHAHQKGIIHRDLKPSNVLVGLYDGNPVPKVIDFGVAKATGQSLTDKTLVTGFGNIVGTLEYMSPEQAEVNQLDVDTRSDIYSLGVLLYELLTGSPPFSRKDLEKAGMLEMLRVIREQEPSKPSMKLSTAEGLPTLAANRGTEPAKLTKLVRGELDWIVMKALEKDRNRRYETANGFATDVQRYLADEPVQACPPSTSYCLKKFARRNSAALAIVAVASLAILLVAGTFGWAIRERAAREQAVAQDQAAREAVLQGKVSQSLDEIENASRLGKFPEAMRVLMRAEDLMASVGVNEDLKQRASWWRGNLDLVTRLQAARMIGLQVNVERNRPNTESAVQAYESALRDVGLDITSVSVEQAARIIGRRPIEVQLAIIMALDRCATWSKSDSDPQKLARVREILGAVDHDAWRRQLRDAATHKDAETLVRLANSPAMANQPTMSLNLLGNLLAKLDRPKQAREVLSQAQQLDPADFWVNTDLSAVIFRQAVPGPDSADMVRFSSNAVAIQPMNAGARLNLGIALYRDGKLNEALFEFQRALELESKYGSPHWWVMRIWIDQGNWEGAITATTKALATEPSNPRFMNDLAWLLVISPQPNSRDPGRALELAKQALTLNPESQEYWRTCGVAHYRLGQWAEARRALEEACRTKTKANGGGNAWEWLWLAMTEWQAGQTQEADQWYDKAVQSERVWPTQLRRFEEEAAQLLNVPTSRRPTLPKIDSASTVESK